MQVPAAVADDLYHRHGYPVESNRQREAFVKVEQAKVDAHPAPVVLQPAK